MAISSYKELSGVARQSGIELFQDKLIPFDYGNHSP